MALLAKCSAAEGFLGVQPFDFGVEASAALRKCSAVEGVFGVQQFDLGVAVLRKCSKDIACGVVADDDFGVVCSRSGAPRSPTTLLKRRGATASMRRLEFESRRATAIVTRKGGVS